jgi:hypothetical protein
VNSVLLAITTRVYRTLLVLYPAEFRAEFGVEMIADFGATTRDAWESRGWPGVFALWVFITADFAWTVVAEWARTGIPAIVMLSVTWTTIMCALIAQQFVPHASVLPPPPRTPDEEVSFLLVGIAVFVWLIAAIVVVTGWFWMFVIRRTRRA